MTRQLEGQRKASASALTTPRLWPVLRVQNGAREGMGVGPGTEGSCGRAEVALPDWAKEQAMERRAQRGLTQIFGFFSRQTWDLLHTSTPNASGW